MTLKINETALNLCLIQFQKTGDVRQKFENIQNCCECDCPCK